jgi:rhodanese-related sulfurtransferase
MKHASSAEAHALQQQGHTYVDVRSTVEFAAGHPAGAINLPLLEPDERTGHMQPNPDFLRVAKAVLPADARILVGCQMGGRSMRAAQMLEMVGFSDVTNVQGGFDGSPYDPGWKRSGLPSETEAERGTSYRSLLDKADAGT